MNKLIIKILVLYTLLICVLIYQRENAISRVENLNRQIELLECYKENYLIMADSLDGIHNSCFRIWK